MHAVVAAQVTPGEVSHRIPSVRVERHRRRFQERQGRQERHRRRIWQMPAKAFAQLLHPAPVETSSPFHCNTRKASSTGSTRRPRRATVLPPQPLLATPTRKAAARRASARGRATAKRVPAARHAPTSNARRRVRPQPPHRRALPQCAPRRRVMPQPTSPLRTVRAPTAREAATPCLRCVCRRHAAPRPRAFAARGRGHSRASAARAPTAGAAA